MVSRTIVAQSASGSPLAGLSTYWQAGSGTAATGTLGSGVGLLACPLVAVGVTWGSGVAPLLGFGVRPGRAVADGERPPDAESAGLAVVPVEPDGTGVGVVEVQASARAASASPTAASRRRPSPAVPTVPSR